MAGGAVTVSVAGGAAEHLMGAARARRAARRCARRLALGAAVVAPASAAAAAAAVVAMVAAAVSEAARGFGAGGTEGDVRGGLPPFFCSEMCGSDGNGTSKTTATRPSPRIRTRYSLVGGVYRRGTDVSAFTTNVRAGASRRFLEKKGR